MMPKSMTFTPKDAQQFQSDADDPRSTIMVATNVKPGQDLSFRVAGAGIFQADNRQGGGGEGGGVRAMPAARWADRKLRPTTIVPAEDWARPSTRPIRCTTIAPTFSERSRWCW